MSSLQSILPGADIRTAESSRSPWPAVESPAPTRPSEPGLEYGTAPEELAATQAQLYAYAVDLRRTVALERARQRQLEQAYLDAVSTLASAVEARDPYTGGHGARVAAYGVGLAVALGWPEAEIEEARLGGLLHDIGKLGVGDAILTKPGYLEEVEWEQIRRHPEVGARILQRAPFLVRTAVYAQHHHERWNGAGYPRGLAGEGIPAGGRLIAIADSFDAMTSDRPYRPAMDPEEAAEEIARAAGAHFDPEMAQAFVWALRDGRIPFARSGRGAPSALKIAA